MLPKSGPGATEAATAVPAVGPSRACSPPLEDFAREYLPVAGACSSSRRLHARSALKTIRGCASSERRPQSTGLNIHSGDRNLQPVGTPYDHDRRCAGPAQISNDGDLYVVQRVMTIADLRQVKIMSITTMP